MLVNAHRIGVFMDNFAVHQRYKTFIDFSLVNITFDHICDYMRGKTTHASEHQLAVVFRAGRTFQPTFDIH